jgi:ribosome-associated toxin RatA of RatAB toxin-antitoxin module
VHTVHRARIAAPFDRVFGLAQDVERWPDLLPAYRWCRVLERAPNRLVFSMGGWVRGWPARWTAVQDAEPRERRLRFEHIGGMTKGMTVVWRFTPDDAAIDVEIEHWLVMRWPLVGRLVSDLIVGPVFIDHIARRTLDAVKARAERPDGEEAR